MTHEQEVKIVKEIFSLELKRNNTTSSLELTQLEKFESCPPPPERLIAPTPEYPPIVPTIKFNYILCFIPSLVCWILGASITLLFFLSIVGTFWIPYYYFFIYKRNKKLEYEKIKNSLEYRNQCDALDKQCAEKQAELDVVNNQKLQEYENTVLSVYNKKLEEWQTKQNEKINELKSRLSDINNQLKNLYNDSKLIPRQYRTIPALKSIKDTITTSEYDVKTAIEMYDRNEQRKLDEARLREQQIANQHAADQNYLLQEQNALAEEQNAITEQARRDANRAAIVSAVQRHNINKKLK